MHLLALDLRYARRVLLKSWGATLTTILTFALGIGATTAIFSAIYAILLRPLPYQDPSELFTVSEYLPKISRTLVFHPTFFAWQAKARAFDDLAAFTDEQGFELTNVPQPERVLGVSVSANLFSTLGVHPTIGRNFVVGEDRPGSTPVAVITHKLWRDTFDSDAHIVGKPIMLDGKTYNVIGVLPPAFVFPSTTAKPAVFIPLALHAEIGLDPMIVGLNVIGRLRSGASIAEATIDLSRIGQAVSRTYPTGLDAVVREARVNAVPLGNALAGDVRSPLILLFISVLFVLLIASLNVANIQLARAYGRRRDAAVCQALGANKLFVYRQLIVENLMLGLVGGTLGLIFAWWSTSLLRHFLEDHVIRAHEIRIYFPVLIFALLITIVTGVLCGLIPAANLHDVNLADALKNIGTRIWGMPTKHSGGLVLVAFETAAAVILVVSTSLVVRSFVRLTHVELGFNPQNLLTARLSLPNQKYASGQKKLTFADSLLRNLKSTPGLRYAAVTSALPLQGFPFSVPIRIEGQPSTHLDAGANVPIVIVSPDYFSALSIPLVGGRTFDEGDGTNKPSIAIVNKAFVLRFLPFGTNPIGKHVLYPSTSPHPSSVEIVGVVDDIHQARLKDSIKPQIFRPFAQFPTSDLFVVLSTITDPIAFSSTVRQQVVSLDKERPVYDIVTMDQLLRTSTLDQRMQTRAMALFSLVALLLVALGVYGVTSYVVSRRTHEMGVRLAVGAMPSEILRLVIVDTIGFVGAGILVGAAGSLIISRFMRGMLFQIKPVDPWSFLLASLVMIAVGLLGCYVPARRAARTDPLLTLRYE